MPSFDSVRAAALVLALVACAADGGAPVPVEPEPSSASAATTAEPDPLSASVATTAEPTAEPEPPAAPPIPNATPATLRLALHGRCQSLGTSTVDGHTFVHYRHGSTAFVHRMDEHGAVAQILPFDGPPDPKATGASTLEGVVGRWPAQLVLSEHYAERADEFRNLHRWADGGWKPIALRGDDVTYEAAWPWHDDSILAWIREGGTYHRLAVVRGEPKAPSMDKLERRSGCDEEEFAVADITVRGDRIAVLGYCSILEPSRTWRFPTWLGTWNAGEANPTVTHMPEGAEGRTVLLDERGDALVYELSDDDPSLVRVSGGKAQRLELPGTRLDAVIQAPDGRAWIVQGSTVSRRTDQGWERLPVPKGRPIVEIAGLEHDTPWLLRKGGALSMQTADGAWHEVAVPPVSELERAPTIDRVRVVAPGDAWVRARHAGKRGAKQTMRALYTTRDAPVPLECGREADASVGT